MCLGILAAQLVNYGTINIPDYGWRISLALAGVPALLLLSGSLFLHDTPSSLVARGKPEEAHAVLKHIRGADEDIDKELENIRAADAANRAIGAGGMRPFKALLERRNWPQLIITLVVTPLVQFSGINAVSAYAPQVR